MAKKTLSSILECPIDFLYLWASDGFIAQLGSKASIIKQKKYYQYQALWKTMVENAKTSDADKLQQEYNSWVDQIAAAITSTYGMTPATILQELALGNDVLGKNWSKGVYGIGNVQISFAQNPSATVDSTTGKILIDGVAPDGQTPIYGNGGVITGYSYYDRDGNVQYQSGMNTSGVYGAVCYTNSNGVQNATGGNFDPSTGTFWQNANNYMPLVNQVLQWVTSIVNSFFPNRTVLTTENTVPAQTEWVEESNSNCGLILSGLAVVGAALVAFGGKKK